MYWRLLIMEVKIIS